MIEMENKNSNKITKLEEQIKHLATKEDMMTSHEAIKDQIQSLQSAIEGLVKELRDIAEKNSEVRKLADKAQHTANLAYTKSIENHDGLEKQGARIDQLLQRLDLHVEGHKQRVQEDIELSIFKSSRIRKIFFFAIFIGMYLFTIKEIRDAVLGIIFMPFT